MTPNELHEVRMGLKLTQKQAAEVLETDVSTISKMEGGRIAIPRRIAQLYAAYKTGFRPANWPTTVSPHLGGGHKR